MTSLFKNILPALILLLATVSANAAGLKRIDIPAERGASALSGAVWYPCPGRVPEEIRFGPTSLTAVRDCSVTGESLPLVVISHGVGGWFGGHHDTAEALADAGFIVAAISHALDSGRSTIRDPGNLASMIERPADIKRLVDYMLGAWSDANRIDPARIGVFGFSRGGYTGLAVAGGTPDFRLVLNNCPTYPGNRWCEQVREGSVLARPIVHDTRIRAAVVADPALGSEFTAAGLKDVSIPVQLWASANGGDGVRPVDVAAVARDLPVRPDYRVVPDAGHFAFLAPCSADFAKAAKDFGEPELCTDAAGFDRVAFHKAFNETVVAFFKKHL